MVSLGAAGSLCPGTQMSSLCDLGAHRARLSHSLPHSSHPCSVLPFLNVLPQRCHQRWWWSLLCSVVGLLWNWLEPVGTSSVRQGAALTSPHRDSRQHLGTGTRYTRYQMCYLPSNLCLYPFLEMLVTFAWSRILGYRGKAGGTVVGKKGNGQ